MTIPSQLYYFKINIYYFFNINRIIPTHVFAFNYTNKKTNCINNFAKNQFNDIKFYYIE